MGWHDAYGAFVGGAIGLIVGFLASGTFLMIYRLFTR
jgi:hypothetical protein